MKERKKKKIIITRRKKSRPILKIKKILRRKTGYPSP